MGIFDSLKRIFAATAKDERSDLEKKLRSAPNDPQLRQKYAACLLRQGEVSAALSELVRTSEMYEKSGFSAKAIAVLRHLLKHDPANVDARRRLIALLAREGLSGDAQAELEKAAAQPGLFAGDEQKVEFLHKTAESLPNSPLPYLLAADLFRLRGKFFDAVAELANAASGSGVSSGFYPQFSRCAAELAAMAGEDPARLEACGFLWLRAGARDEGLALLEKAVEAARSSGGEGRIADMERALAALRSGEAAGAISFSDAIDRIKAREAPAAVSPPSVPAAEPQEAHPVEGQGEKAGGEAKTVREALLRLKKKVTEEIGDSDREARYNLGIAYKEMGLLDEAAEEFRISRASPHLFLGASVLLAETLAEKGDLDGALACLEEVLGPAEAEEAHARDILYRKGMLLSQAGRKEEAQAVFRAIYEKDPGYRDVRERVEAGGD